MYPVFLRRHAWWASEVAASGPLAVLPRALGLCKDFALGTDVPSAARATHHGGRGKTKVQSVEICENITTQKDIILDNNDT